MGTAASEILYGDFIRVRADDPERPGDDGMVWMPPDENGDLGMLFAYDRYGRAVMHGGGYAEFWRYGPCEGVELWNLSELDLSTIDR